jgi:hypothetical protein
VSDPQTAKVLMQMAEDYDREVVGFGAYTGDR